MTLQCVQQPGRARQCGSSDRSPPHTSSPSLTTATIMDQLRAADAAAAEERLWIPQYLQVSYGKQ